MNATGPRHTVEMAADQLGQPLDLAGRFLHQNQVGMFAADQGGDMLGLGSDATQRFQLMIFMTPRT
jgi:hypothetical protein